MVDDIDGAEKESYLIDSNTPILPMDSASEIMDT